MECVVVYSYVVAGYAKGHAGDRLPEDKPNSAPTESDKVHADRTQRIVDNDLENIPYVPLSTAVAVLCICQYQYACPSGGYRCNWL